MGELPVVDDTAALIERIQALAVVHGEVTLSSGQTAAKSCNVGAFAPATVSIDS